MTTIIMSSEMYNSEYKIGGSNFGSSSPMLSYNTSNSSNDTISTTIKATNTWSSEFRFYGHAFVIPFGLLCNLFAIIVFLLSAPLRKTTTGHFLTALACTDFLFLCGELMLWMNVEGKEGYYLNISYLDNSRVLCKTAHYIRYSTKLISAWIITVICFERFISVTFPLRVAKISTPFRAKIILLTIVVVSLALGSYPLWTVGLYQSSKMKTPRCRIVNVSQYNDWSMAILRVGTLGLPSLLIIIFTSAIIVQKDDMRESTNFEKPLSLQKTIRFSTFAPQNKQ